MDPSRGSAPASQGSGAEVSILTDAPLSGAGQLIGLQVGLSVLTSGLTAAQAEEIFLLSHEIQTLHGKLALDFIKMSHTEANFRMGAQAASHESMVQESRTGETWLHINSLLFHHAIDHQQFLIWLINRSQEAIQALHDRVWKVVHQVMESAGRSAADGIGIALHLVGLLLTIPLQPAFNTVTPEPPGYTPRALTYVSQDSIDRGTMSALGEELIRDPARGQDQAVQVSSHVMMTDTISTRFATVQGTGDDHPGPNFSLHSPTYSPSRSPFRSHHSRLAGRESNSLEPSMPSLDSSIPGESVSDTKTSLSDSDSRGRSRPDSPDVIFLGNANNNGPEEDPISLRCFSESDTVEVHVAAVCKKAHQSDVLYATWLDNQIHTGHNEVKWRDSSVHDHTIPGKRCEAPDIIGPPISYMEERRMFKPAEFVNNLKGLCRFYHTSPGKSNLLVGPKSAKSARRIHCLIQIAKGLGRQLTLVVFEGESVTPKCLLSKLHSCMALSQYALHTSDEAKMGIRHRVFCCPICEYVANNPTTFLNHIVVGHYWGSFSCGVCLAFATHTAVGMIAHFIGCGQCTMECSNA